MSITRTEFTSGLRVVSERMPGVRSVSIGIWVLAGSRDERPAISGHCHFLEHLLFKGTDTRTALDIAEAFDAVGGDVNAFTAKEYTCYYARVLDRDLEMAVDYLVDMLQHSTISAQDLAAESDVILSEIDMHEDSPEDVVHDVFTEALWPGHPLGRPILGTKDRIASSTRASVRGFYRRHYVPGRLVISVAGNVRHDKLLAMLATRMDVGRPLGARGRSAKEFRANHRAPKPSGAGVVKHKPVEQAHVVLGTNGLPRTDPDRFAFLIVNTVLGGGMSSRLFQEIREKRGLAYTAYSYHSQYTEAGVFSAYAGTTPGKAAEVIALMRHEIEAVRDGGITTEEFERAKSHVRGSTVLSLEDPGSRMSRLGKSEIAHGEILTLDETLRRVGAVTLDDAHAVAEQVLSRPMTLAVVGPKSMKGLRGVAS
jgi:predicted Zn-dependent peptidase